MTCGQKYGRTCPNYINEKRDSDGIEKTQDERCTPIEKNLSHCFGWSGIWHRHQECKNKIGNAHGIRHAVLNISVSFSQGEPCEEAHLRETSCTKEEDKSNTFYARKNWCVRISTINENCQEKLEEHIADSGYNPTGLDNLVHVPIPIPKSYEHSGSEGCKRQGMEQIQKFAKLVKSIVRNRSNRGRKKIRHNNSFLLRLWTCATFKLSEFDNNFQKYKGRVVMRGDAVEDDSGSHAVFTEQGSCVSHLTAAKVLDVISRLPGCAGEARDAVSHSGEKWMMLPNCQDHWKLNAQ